MSKLLTIRVNMSSVEAAVGALRLLGFNREDLEEKNYMHVWDGVSDKPTMVPYGYQKELPADIVLKKQVWGGYGDLGIAIDGENSAFYVDDIDDRKDGRLARFVDKNTDYKLEGMFSETLPQWYATYSAGLALKKQGLIESSFSQRSDGCLEMLLVENNGF